MSYEPSSDIFKLLYYWQTLVAGLLAIIAAAGTIWATISSANREIAASQAQTKVAQDQLATTLQLEKRRLAREGYAFCAMMEATMGRVIAEVEKGETILARTSASTGLSSIAYEARQSFSKIGFSELRSACVRYGGFMTTSFLEIESDVDSFSSKWEASPTTGDPSRIAYLDGVPQELNAIRIKAENLRNEASAGMRSTTAILGETG